MRAKGFDHERFLCGCELENKRRRLSVYPCYEVCRYFHYIDGITWGYVTCIYKMVVERTMRYHFHGITALANKLLCACIADLWVFCSCAFILCLSEKKVSSELFIE